MAINLADELNAATVKGKIASAKQVYLEGDTKNLQQLGEETQQLKDSINDISVTGGASTANAVSYDNSTSGMEAVNAQGAIDELKEITIEQAQTILTSFASLTAKDNKQDTEIAKKANSSDVDSQMQTEQTRVNAELDKKFDKDNVVQELGDAEDKVVSQYALPFRIEESPEWAYFIKDAEDHVLFGIQQDGSVEWQVGIPAPIRKRFDEIVSSASDDKSKLTDAINALKDELTASLQAYQQTTDASISSLQDTKVDKEEGKSLIDDEVKEHFEVIENEEWLTLMADAEDHILFGIKRDTGKPYFPLNEMYHVEQSPEFFALWKDAEDHILMGIRRDGEIVGEIHAVNALKQTIADIQSNIETLQNNLSDVTNNVTSVDNKITTVSNNLSTLNTKVSTIDASLKELLDVISLQEIPEYLAIETDAEGKLLASTNLDGSHYAYNMKSETIDVKVDKEDGKSLIDENVANAQSVIDDVEGRMSMETDADGKIMAYRDKDGVKHEHEAEVNTLHVSNLDLKDNSVNDIQSALIANGFNVKTPIDWSESSFIQIPEPRFAIINITNIDSMPTTKTQNKKAFLEFWDMQGNYFKKHVIANAQGNSSMGFIKKNAAFDFCDDEWIGDETPKIRFGNWVPQDSFHMKAYYTDFFRGVGAVSYKLYDQIVRTRGNMYDRPWKKALLDMSKIGTTTKSLGNPYIGDYSLLTDTGARCFPDGFPVACYLNGEFYGIFSWQLKKHRDNYHMDKSTAEHVHLDGTLYTTTIFNGKDNIDWSQFEIRNPKGLYAIGGNKYDADVKQEEIAGETEVNAWIETNKLPDGTAITAKIKKALQMTAKVKKYIQDFADAIPAIKTAMATYEASSKTEEDLSVFKKVYETYFDVENMIDYMIASDIIKNSDGFNKNWQWFTYDGKKWWVGLYDCDMSFGGHFSGNQITSVLTSHLNSSTSTPNGYVIKYYNDDMLTRYKQLADSGIISASNILSIVKDWVMRIGTDFYKEEYAKWKDSPCIADSVVRTDYWEQMADTEGNPQTDTSETFNATTAYSVGDEVSFGLNSYMGYFKFKCIKETAALGSNTPHTVSAYSPIKQFKHCDNLYRIQKWIEQNTANMDKLYNYKRN